MNATYEGRPYLGAALGSSTYVNEFVSGKVHQWSKELNLLSVIAASHGYKPHPQLLSIDYSIGNLFLGFNANMDKLYIYI